MKNYSFVMIGILIFFSYRFNLLQFEVFFLNGTLCRLFFTFIHSRTCCFFNHGQNLKALNFMLLVYKTIFTINFVEVHVCAQSVECQYMAPTCKCTVYDMLLNIHLLRNLRVTTFLTIFASECHLATDLFYMYM